MGPKLKRIEKMPYLEEQFGGLKLLILPQSFLRMSKNVNITLISIRIDLQGWIRIRIRIETNADPQHWD